MVYLARGDMKVPRAILISGSVLAFDFGVFQATIAFSPEWTAAFGVPRELVSNPPLLLAAGFLMSAALMISGLYGLSGAGVVRRLPLLRPVLLAIGTGFALAGMSLVPQLLVLTHVVSTDQPIIIQPVIASFVLLLTGLLYLAGLASGWRYLSAGAPGGALNLRL